MYHMYGMYHTVPYVVVSDRACRLAEAPLLATLLRIVGFVLILCAPAANDGEKERGDPTPRKQT